MQHLRSRSSMFRRRGPTALRSLTRQLSTQANPVSGPEHVRLPINLVRKRALKDLRYLLTSDVVKKLRAVKAFGEEKERELEKWGRWTEVALQKEEREGKRERKVVVIGEPESCKAIVFSLLEDKLASDQTNTKLLKNRGYLDLGDNLSICSIRPKAPSPLSSEEDVSTSEPNTLYLTDPWLQETNIQIDEVHVPSLSGSTSYSPKLQELLLASDTILVVVNSKSDLHSLSNLTTLLQDFPNVTVISDGTSNLDLFPESKVLEVQTNLLNSNDFGALAASGIIPLKSFLSTPPRSTLSTLLHSAFEFMETVNTAEDAWIASQAEVIGELMEKLLKKEKEICEELKVKEDGSLVVDDGVFMRSREVLSNVLKSRFGWWKLLWRSDDITVETKAALEGIHLQALELELAFRLGYISSHAQQFDDIVTSAHSPLLTPTLLTALPPFPPLSPYTLHGPINDRRQQISRRLSSLQRTSQLLLIRSYTLSFLSISLPISGYYLSLLEASSVTGCSVFGLVFSAWILQRGWEKAQRTFWKDWDRVKFGLETELGRVVNELLLKVFGRHRTALKALEGRKEEVEKEVKRWKEETRKANEEWNDCEEKEKLSI